MSNKIASITTEACKPVPLPQAKPRRFNIDEFLPIIKSFQESAQFTITSYPEEQRQAASIYFRVRLPVSFDPNKFNEHKHEDLDNAIYRFIQLIEGRAVLLGTQPRDAHGKPGYVWLREQRSEEDIVYHIILLTHRDAQFFLGEGEPRPGTLSYNLSRLWCEAVGLDSKTFGWLMHMPHRAYQAYSKNKTAEPLLKRINFLVDKMLVMAQLHPEPWENGLQMFGYSEVKARPVSMRR